VLALEIDKADIKGFMGQLLKGELFDAFEVRSVDMTAGVRFNIEGMLAETGFVRWAVLRQVIYEIIKVSPKPQLIKIVFSYGAVNMVQVHPNAAALFLNLIYEHDSIHFTTATAQKAFALDKSLEMAWDERVRLFFHKSGIKLTDRLI